MEKKKLKKLVLNKDVISKLENVEMNQMRGGGADSIFLRSVAYGGLENPFNCLGVDCYVEGPTKSCQSCYAVESCVPMNCYGAESDHPGCGATIYFTECGGGYF